MLGVSAVAFWFRLGVFQLSRLTYALVCIAETFQNTQTEIFLDEGKPEDKLQELQSHCQTVLNS